MPWAWVARRVASDGRAQPQGAEKRPSEMCALDRHDRLVIRPPPPAGPEDLQTTVQLRCNTLVLVGEAANTALGQATMSPAVLLLAASAYSPVHR